MTDNNQHNEAAVKEQLIHQSVKQRSKLRIGITIGDINGIGVEVMLKIFQDNRMLDHFTPIIYGSSRVISYHRKVLKAENFSYNMINSIDRTKDGVCNVLNCWTEDIAVTLGQSNKKTGIFAFRALESAMYDILNGEIDAIVTAPVNKSLLSTEEQVFTGHTEYLTEKFVGAKSLMFLVNEGLKVGLVTNHVPVTKVASLITEATILQKLKIMDISLRQDFGIVRPRIAVFGLNPHAGDNGLIGQEEQEVIIPAIEKAKAKHNLLVFGPYAADGFFGSGLYKQFDAILAMYHDQGLVPFKALSFGDGVNFTAGLPIVRTSPDHGTAYDIAGKNIANPDSLRQALFLAKDIVMSRRNYADMIANPLQKGQKMIALKDEKKSERKTAKKTGKKIAKKGKPVVAPKSEKKEVSSVDETPKEDNVSKNEPVIPNQVEK